MQHDQNALGSSKIIFSLNRAEIMCTTRTWEIKEENKVWNTGEWENRLQKEQCSRLPSESGKKGRVGLMLRPTAYSH